MDLILSRILLQELFPFFYLNYSYLTYKKENCIKLQNVYLYVVHFLRIAYNAYVEEIYFPHSIGLLYSAFTYYLGFKVNSGEYKVMGLAPYGKPKYKELIIKKLIDLKDDGSFRLNMKYFNYATGFTMTSLKFDNFLD